MQVQMIWMDGELVPWSEERPSSAAGTSVTAAG
jgi:hypothetical protein